MTKALANRLVQVADDLIHRDQAGFVKRWSIFYQIDLAKDMIHYAEAEEIDGIIVALDQEKAYNKIKHDYLWGVMDRMMIPQTFISTVRHLYEGAETVVIINGEKSAPFHVTRGVRQGDPLSCLLFNLVIEPLAQMLHDSFLEGYRIPNVRDRLIAMLFTDNTTVYLSNRDSWEELRSILDLWCQASGAKFNIEKTQVIPIGNPDYRCAVLETRRISLMQDAIPVNMHIAHDGEAVRILGAFVGNAVDMAMLWTQILNHIQEKFDMWEWTHPTIEGRRLLIQIYAGELTQF